MSVSPFLLLNFFAIDYVYFGKVHYGTGEYSKSVLISILN